MGAGAGANLRGHAVVSRKAGHSMGRGVVLAVVVRLQVVADNLSVRGVLVWGAST